MRLSAFQEHYSLHDSPINSLHFFPEQGKLIVEVDICDDGQWPFPNKSDPMPLTFVFTGVSHYSVSTGSLDCEQDEIHDARLLPSEKPGKEIIEFVLFTTSNQGTEDVKFLQIEAESVNWVFF
ncbi:hypothetical protein KSX_55630 [Ktedonospora formicarum]|uniref:Uncharacterized protein n=1 Tax=Ktedonospora formicarum TaxID=2778364 RepID=A0A8J3I5W5_9CHLR|nr:hypothetical protein KSX_55630 [Ktedonospora formicarum]